MSDDHKRTSYIPCVTSNRLRCPDGAKFVRVLGLAAGLWLVGLFPSILTHTAWAASLDDPFKTDKLTSPGPLGHAAVGLARNPCVFPPTPGPLSLIDVVDRVLCRNPQTREVWAAARVQAAQVGVADAAYLPTLNADASLTNNHASTGSSNAAAQGNTRFSETSGSVTLSYLLYDFGGRQATRESARQLLAAANATQDSTVQNLFLSGAQGYYQVLAAQAAVDSEKEAERSSLEGFKAAQARYIAGVGTPADRLQAETAYSQAVLNRIRAEGVARNAQGALANRMGYDADFAFTLMPSSAPQPSLATFEHNVGELIAEARRNRPDLAAAEAQVKSAEADIKSVRASGMPSISLSTSAAETDFHPGNTFRNSSIGVSISIPLFSGFSTSYQVRAAKETLAVKVAQRDSISQQVALDVWNAYQDLNTETQAIRSSEDLVASATQNERVALGRYKAGAGIILDVINAQAQLANARLQLIQSRLNWNVARATLAQSLGRIGYDMLDTLAGGAPANAGQK
jgi:outer membrane protein